MITLDRRSLACFFPASPARRKPRKRRAPRAIEIRISRDDGDLSIHDARTSAGRAAASAELARGGWSWWEYQIWSEASGEWEEADPDEVPPSFRLAEATP